MTCGKFLFWHTIERWVQLMIMYLRDSLTLFDISINTSTNTAPSKSRNCDRVPRRSIELKIMHTHQHIRMLREVEHCQLSATTAYVENIRTTVDNRYGTHDCVILLCNYYPWYYSKNPERCELNVKRRIHYQSSAETAGKMNVNVNVTNYYLYEPD